MNRFAKLVKENLLPSIVFAILVVSCGSAWYFFHPASPYHARYTFVVSYEAIGTLSPGNRVEVRGIAKGQILKVELTDDAVFVTAEVLADTKIPVNSEYRLINSGLMGEREMCILTGDSDQLIHPGDTVIGQYDEGTSGVMKNLDAALKDLDVIMDTVNAVLDSLSYGDSRKRLDRVISKGKNIVNLAQSDVRSWLDDASQVLENLDGSLNKAKSILEDVGGKAGPKLDEVASLLERVNPLLSKVEELKNRAVALADPLGKDDNTAGAVLNGEEFSRELDKLSKDVKALVDDMKKNGVRFNVDIF